MAEFNEFFPHVLENEGGFVDHPSDPGGATNKGITMNTFKAYAEKYLGIEPTLENLKNLTDEQAFIIYKKFYWDKVKGDDYKTQELANMVFDFYVNAGANAAKALQRTLNELGGNVVVDGIIGSGTLKAVNEANQVELYNKYKEARKQYYINLTEKNSSLKVFLKGWLNRVNKFPDMA